MNRGFSFRGASYFCTSNSNSFQWSSDHSVSLQTRYTFFPSGVSRVAFLTFLSFSFCSPCNFPSDLFAHRNKSSWTRWRSARSASAPPWRSAWRASSAAPPSWPTPPARATTAASASWPSATPCARLCRTSCPSTWAT